MKKHILDNIKPFSKENQDRINQSKNKLKEIDNIAKEQYKQTQSIKDKLGTKRTLEGVDVPPAISKPSLKKSVTEPVEKASLEILKAGKVVRNPNLKINEQIADLIYTGRVSDDKFLEILKKYKVTDKDFAKFFSYNASDAGRTLQSLSVIQRQLNKLAKVPGADDDFS